ncbi:hypothetical protein DBR11_27745 [Pedobacter sp. HMWF019]|uniref:exosortase Y-associated Wzy-like protein n=1 Tax=Pedobacter sp. HMWF019 TaxID=2056856 RepID=UPI000D352726|nr:hypothetical protein [Pedobacter sp. HMWF019]PTS91996.1 hypothetical protein DBR11_27745 [Pedobacter sp. HMWF019]
MSLTSSTKIQNLFTIAIPWLISLALAHHPVLSYLIAFSGSWFIFYYTLFSPWKYTNSNQTQVLQVMRPIVLIQLIFAGFMCCTSIFYFADHIGYKYLESVKGNFIISPQTFIIAKSQQIALLGHIGLVTGIQYQTKTLFQKYQCTMQLTPLLIRLYFISFLCTLVLDHYPSFLQIKYYLLHLSACCLSYLFISGFFHRRPFQITLAGAALSLQLLSETLSGYKESLLVNLLLIGFISFPYFRKTVLIFFLPLLYLLLYTLPTLSLMIRTSSWNNHKPSKDVRREAFEFLLSGSEGAKISDNNWNFLTYRFSETDMFCQYIKSVPDQQPYYGFEILRNSFYALIPRTFWSQKPNTEKVSMERVYTCGAVNRLSAASAKTRPVTDAYLSGGTLIVFVAMFLYGLIAQWLCNKAENIFGGYPLGCIIIFNGFFQPLWRGNNWEFLINNITYGFFMMLLLFHLLKHFQILQKIKPC